MIFLIKFIHSFLPAIFFISLLYTIFLANKRKNGIKRLFVIGILSILIGACIQEIAIYSLYSSEAINTLRTLLLFSFLIFALSSIFPASYLIFDFLVFSLLAYGGADFIDTTKDLSLSSTNVINTDFILNVSGIFLSIILVCFFAFAISKFTINYRKKRIFNFFLLLSFALFIVDLVAKIMLFLIKKDFLEMTTTRLSFVAKVTYFDYLFAYYYVAVLCFFTLCFFIKNRKNRVGKNLLSPLRRKLEKTLLIQRRWIRATATTIAVLLFCMLYYDLYISKPISLSDSVMIKPNKDGNFVISLKDVDDGGLYRFAYIGKNGHKIRFFVINRFPGQHKVSAVFDACITCGDAGYVKKGNQVICVACGVRIFIPSIGRSGGCNPIPFKSRKKDGNLIITQSVIQAGSSYFTQIVEKEVKDPISGAVLKNITAPFTYDYLGKTYYFESEKNLEDFRSTPVKYIKREGK